MKLLKKELCDGPFQELRARCGDPVYWPVREQVIGEIE